MKQYFMIAIFLFLFMNVGYAQNLAIDTGSSEIKKTVCPEYTLNLGGELILKKGVEQKYSVTRESSDIGTGGQVSYELWDQEKMIMSSKEKSLVYTFDKEGTYLLKVFLTSSPECVFTEKFPLHVYKSIYTYIGLEMEEFTLAHEGMTDTGVYIKEFLLDSTISTEQLTKILADEVYYIDHSDVLLLESSFVSPFFETLSTLQELVGFTIHDLALYVLADINQSAFRRMLARYHGVMGLEKISVVEKQYMGSFFTSLFLGKNLADLSFVKTYAVSLAYSNKRLVISYLVDYLLQHEFPIGTLLFILMLPFLVILISIFRQIVGLSIFGVFNPLIFSFSLHIIGTPLTFIFFISAFFATILMRMFTKKVYLLYSAKISLLVVLYSIISLIVLWAVHYFGRIDLDYSLFQNTYIIFPFLFLLMVGDRVFSEKFYLFDKGWRVGLLEFLMVSTIMYWLMNSIVVQNILLGYPELSLVSIIILILVGRFTGLQILEYVRFMPLIRHYFEEEEE